MSESRRAYTLRVCMAHRITADGVTFFRSPGFDGVTLRELENELTRIAGEDSARLRDALRRIAGMEPPELRASDELAHLMARVAREAMEDKNCG